MAPRTPNPGKRDPFRRAVGPVCGHPMGPDGVGPSASPMSPVVAGWTGSGPVADHWGMRSSPAPWFVRPGARDWRCEPPPVAARRFHVDLPGYRPTPLVDLPALAEELGVGRVLVKDESSRLGLPAFKVLGASWAVYRALEERLPEGAFEDWETVGELKERLEPLRPLDLVAATDGNHGRALARVARLLGLGAKIFVPEGMAAARREAIAGEGAEVIVVKGTYDEAVERSAAEEGERGLVISDMSWPGYEQIPSWVIEGYSTMLWEIDDELERRK